jgi:VWFA-related protein
MRYLRFMRLRLGLGLLVLCIGSALTAQRPLVESIEVRVVNVDVVVTDRSGKPVTGLTRADFQLVEEGKPQEITNFYEIRSGDDGQTRTQDGAEVRPRRFFFFLDATSLHPAIRDEVIGGMRRFVAEQMLPEDQAAVVAWNGQIQVLSPLTRSRSEIDAALVTGAKTSSHSAIRSEILRIQQRCSTLLDMAMGGRMNIRAAYLDCINAAHEETDATAAAARRTLNALRVTLAMMNGVDGRKVLVVAGSQLPKKPGVDSFQWANSLFLPYLSGWNAPRERYTEDRPLSFDIAELGHLANSAGVSMYLLNAPTTNDVMTVTGNAAVVDAGLNFFHNANTAESFAELARLTGGASADHRSQPDALFRAMRVDLGTYYSLGYRPAERGGPPRTIVVRTKNRDLVVRARQSYTERSAEEQMSDRVIANVFHPVQNAEFAIGVHAGAQSGSGRTTKIPLEVVIPAKVLTLLPEGSMLRGGFTVWIAVGDARGALSTVSRSPQVVEVPIAEEKKFRGTPLFFNVDVTVRPGESVLSVAVTDHVGGGAGFGRAFVKTD